MTKLKDVFSPQDGKIICFVKIVENKSAHELLISDDSNSVLLDISGARAHQKPYLTLGKVIRLVNPEVDVENSCLRIGTKCGIFQGQLEQPEPNGATNDMTSIKLVDLKKDEIIGAFEAKGNCCV